MEKLFGSESVIKELEEDYSDTDEEEEENHYRESKSRKGFPSLKKPLKSNSSDHYRPPTKSKSRKIKPFTDLHKLQTKPVKANPRPKFSPYVSNEGTPGQITVLKKAGSPQNPKYSRGSKMPTSATSTHTSSIPNLPPVVKDSWFKDRLARQNLDDLKKRLDQKSINLIEVYNDSEKEAKSSIEVPYVNRENPHRQNFRYSSAKKQKSKEVSN